MFDKLRRAKSFIIRSQPKEEPELSETSHLRRVTPIKTKVLSARNLIDLSVTSEVRITPTTSEHLPIIQERNVGRNFMQETCTNVSEKKKSNNNWELQFGSSDTKQTTNQLRNMPLKGKNESTSQKPVSNFHSGKQKTSGKKVTRSKSAREPRAQFMKKYSNASSLKEDV